ncbi:hypothetical protein WMF30_05980 [Sorangium sp. So ce134]
MATDGRLLSGLAELARVRLAQGRAAETAALGRASAAARARIYGTELPTLDDHAIVHVEALRADG